MNNMYKISLYEIEHIDMALQSRLINIDKLLDIFSKDGSTDLYDVYTKERHEVYELKNRLLSEFFINKKELIAG